MKSILIHLSLQILFNYIKISCTIYKEEYLTITDYTDEAATLTGDVLSDSINCAKKNDKKNLGATTDVHFMAVSMEDSSTVSSAICTKSESPGTNKFIKIESDKVSSILYKVGKINKILFVSPETTNCHTVFTVKPEEVTADYIHVDYIKCILNADIPDFKKENFPEPKPFVEDTKKICFVHDLMKGPIELKIKKSDTLNVPVTLSPYPSPKCPQCPPLEESKTCNSK